MTFAGVRPVLHTPFGGADREPILEPEIRRLASSIATTGVDGGRGARSRVGGLGDHRIRARAHRRRRRGGARRVAAGGGRH